MVKRKVKAPEERQVNTEFQARVNKHAQSIRDRLQGLKERQANTEFQARVNKHAQSIRDRLQGLRVIRTKVPDMFGPVSAATPRGILAKETPFHRSRMYPYEPDDIQISDRNLAYIAGLFDGEVSFNIESSQHSYFLSLKWTKTHYFILRFVKNILGGSVIKVKPQPSYRFDVWLWTIFGGNAYRALRKVYPFLRIKKEDAANCLIFYERYYIGHKRQRHVSKEQQAIGALYMSRLQKHQCKSDSDKENLSTQIKTPLSAPVIQESIQAPSFPQTHHLLEIGLPELELAYIAGLLDVESTFLIYNLSGRPSYLLEVNYRKTDYNILQYLAGIFGGKVRPALSTSNKRDVWLWKLCSMSAYDLLRHIYPFLLVKKRPAEICIEFFELYWQGCSGKPVSPERQAIGAKYVAQLKQYHPKSIPHRRRGIE